VMTVGVRKSAGSVCRLEEFGFPRISTGFL
jgi:hypothetical protein